MKERKIQHKQSISILSKQWFSTSTLQLSRYPDQNDLKPPLHKVYKVNEKYKKQTKGDSLEYNHPADKCSECDHLHDGPTTQKKQNGVCKEVAFGHDLHGGLREENVWIKTRHGCNSQKSLKNLFLFSFRFRWSFEIVGVSRARELRGGTIRGGRHVSWEPTTIFIVPLYNTAN